MALVSAMHITSGVYVNDWEDGLIADFQAWLEKLAPAGLPYRHHQTGEDNADAHLKRTIMGHQVIVPITGGRARPRARGSRSSMPSSTAGAASASSSRSWVNSAGSPLSGSAARRRRRGRSSSDAASSASRDCRRRVPAPYGRGAGQAAVRAAGRPLEPARRHARNRRDARGRSRARDARGNRSDRRRSAASVDVSIVMRGGRPSGARCGITTCSSTTCAGRSAGPACSAGSDASRRGQSPDPRRPWRAST